MSPEEYFKYHREICDEARKLSERKNNDYANPNAHQDDKMRVFRNFLLCEQMNICTTESGMLVRLSDKFMRISNLLRPGHQRAVTDESIKDTIEDIINYVILLLAYLKTKSDQTTKVAESK